MIQAWHFPHSPSMSWQRYLAVGPPQICPLTKFIQNSKHLQPNCFVFYIFFETKFYKGQACDGAIAKCLSHGTGPTLTACQILCLYLPEQNFLSPDWPTNNVYLISKRCAWCMLSWKVFFIQQDTSFMRYFPSELLMCRPTPDSFIYLFILFVKSKLSHNEPHN